MPTKRVTSECDECVLVLLRSNMSRHLQSHQPQKRVRSSSASASLSCRATTLSAGRPTSPATQSTGDNVFYAMSTEDGTRCKPVISNPIITSIPKRTTVHPRLSLEEYLIANAAAASLTEQHHIYNLDGLCDYVADHFPSVPAAVRPYLVIGAVAGAQHAAQIHYLADAHRMAREPDKREIARRAKCSLSNWVLGIRNQQLSSSLHKDQDDLLHSNRVDAFPAQTDVPVFFPATTQSTTVSADETVYASLMDVNLQSLPHSSFSVQRLIENLEQDVGLSVVQASMNPNASSEGLSGVDSGPSIQSVIFPAAPKKQTSLVASLPVDISDGESSDTDDLFHSQHVPQHGELPQVAVAISGADRHAADIWMSKSQLPSSGVCQRSSQDPGASSAPATLDAATVATSMEINVSQDLDVQAEPTMTPLPGASTVTCSSGPVVVNQEKATRKPRQPTSTVTRRNKSIPVPSSDDELPGLIIDLSAPVVDDDLALQSDHGANSTPTKKADKQSSIKLTTESRQTAPKSVVSKAPPPKIASSSTKDHRPQDDSRHEPCVRDQRPHSKDRHSANRHDREPLHRRDRSRSPRRQTDRRDDSRRYLTEQEYTDFQKWKRQIHK